MSVLPGTSDVTLKFCPPPPAPLCKKILLALFNKILLYAYSNLLIASARPHQNYSMKGDEYAFINIIFICHKSSKTEQCIHASSNGPKTMQQSALTVALTYKMMKKYLASFFLDKSADFAQVCVRICVKI